MIKEFLNRRNEYNGSVSRIGYISTDNYLTWYAANYPADICSYSKEEDEALLRDPEHKFGSVFPELK